MPSSYDAILRVMRMGDVHADYIVTHRHYTSFFFFNDTATTEIYTLSLHDALPICRRATPPPPRCPPSCSRRRTTRSEEHTSELQSQSNLVCRLLLEKKKSLVTPTFDYVLADLLTSATSGTLAVHACTSSQYLATLC